MSWSFVGHRGSSNNKNAGAVLAHAPTGTLSAGNIAVAVAVSDNVSTGGGQTQDHVVADFKGNSWQKIIEQSNAAAAGAGLTLSVWICRLTVPLLTTDSVVFGIRAAATAKALALYEYSVAAGNVATFIAAAATEQDGTASPTVTLSGLADEQYAFLGVVAREEDNAGTYTADADFNDRAKFGTTGGGVGTNVSCIVGDRIVSGAGDTFNPANLSVAADVVSVLVAMKEVDAARSCAITITDARVADRKLAVTYSRNGDSGGNVVFWDVDFLDQLELQRDQLEDFMLRGALTWARRRNLSPAQMIGKTFMLSASLSRDLMTVT